MRAPSSNLSTKLLFFFLACQINLCRNNFSPDNLPKFTPVRKLISLLFNIHCFAFQSNNCPQRLNTSFCFQKLKLQVTSTDNSYLAQIIQSKDRRARNFSFSNETADWIGNFRSLLFICSSVTFTQTKLTGITYVEVKES